MTQPSHEASTSDGGPIASISPASPGEAERIIEALLFTSATPVTTRELAARLPEGCDIAGAITRLRAHYHGRGIHIVRAGNGWAMRTAPDLGGLLQRRKAEARALSRAAVETLAIIAYHQPVTRADIEEIRGVGVSRGTLDQLLEREWIKFGRRKQGPGRPATFVVTGQFLDHFGLETAKDLPGLAELRAAGLLQSQPRPHGAPLAAQTEASPPQNASTPKSKNATADAPHKALHPGGEPTR
ncbi:MAG: SMC-Scp complex subunit ScpB [Rhodobacteraceae bacterium]|nr:SMC-Scp complex subunit ScpB [Paracoccaceae bacterium]